MNVDKAAGRDGGGLDEERGEGGEKVEEDARGSEANVPDQS